jgi:hypothetical protein
LAVLLVSISQMWALRARRHRNPFSSPKSFLENL